MIFWSLEVLAKKLSQDLKSLSQWLKANKLSLNVKKTELIIFRRKAANIDYGIKFKLDGKRLTPVNTVKYLGIWTNIYSGANNGLMFKES